MTSSQDTVKRRQREQWVDNLRVVVIAGVVVMHASTAYLGGADWYYMERTTNEVWSTVLVFPASAGALFGLGPLFLLAGWFSARSLAHRGLAAFVRSRLLRLGVPLIVFVYLIDPLSAYVGDLGEGRSGSLAWYLGIKDAEAGPMWFVAALLVFSLAYAVLRRLHPAPDSRLQLRPSVIVATALTIAVSSFAVWQRWPLDADDTFLNLRWGLWPQGAVLFALGVRAAEVRGPGNLTPLLARRLGWIALAGLALLVTLASVELARGEIEAAGTGAGWSTMVLAVLYGAISVTWTLWLVAWVRGRWSAHGAILARAGRASYATYFLHPLVLTAIMVLFASVALAPELKFLLVTAAAVPACFTVGHAITGVPGISKVL